MSIEYYRPELHLTAEAGVLDAPAAVLLDGDTWHVFHQYRPHPAAPARWGHQFSEDTPYEWEECDDVLAPAEGEAKVRAGSVAAIDGGLNLYFTSVTEQSGAHQSTEIHLARIDNLPATTADLSEDPLAVDSQVRRLGPVVGDETGAQAGITNFRSPCVVPDWVTNEDRNEGHAGWLMLAVTGTMAEPGLAMLHSEDGRDWLFQGVLRFEEETGIDPQSRIVSPRILRLRDEVDGQIHDVLLVTLESEGIDVSGYLVGHLHEAVFTVSSPFRRIDYGHDFTRPRNTTFTFGTMEEDDRFDRAAIVGQLNGVGRLDDPTAHRSLAAEGWANAMSIPRVTTLQGGVLFQTPAAGLVEQITHTQRAQSWTGLCEVPEGSEVTVELIDATGAPAASISHRGSTLVLDRSMNPHHTGDVPATAPLAEGDSDSLTIIVDGSTVEVFADGGAVSMASRVYIEGGCAEIRVHESGAARVERCFQRSAGSLDTSRLPDWAEEELDAEF
ncbi:MULTISPECIES: glycoside hydrolase family 32 protein [unclassified Corynebacterium]|uniref:glycoside hydrolase family 32 protein n=1 Tax=unclassified Corynebacterium TaxID=2624378 RepID=UPI0029CA34AD|nr:MULTISPECIES: GH32 C-terminal domain-containing protein [unclassified Corynebacterium]WPF66970.1 GH32 C-terminal domain-containing protein [Corynebacterium sp. 22KM0430]WPF69458.1 GH32 C-terminal domain-containing protein [Corynebacterium sp. 21KM1197]